MEFPFKAVVFDADGTLFDTEELMHQVWTEVGEELDFPYPARDYPDFVGLNRAAVLALMEQKYGTGMDYADFMVRCVDRLQARMETEGVPLKPGVREVLDFLREHRIPTALATSTHRVRTDRRLELTGLTGYFQAVVTGDEVTHGKPHPEIYWSACRKLNVEPARALAVEDSRNGILSAHAAGMPVVMVPDLIPPTLELEELLLKKLDSLHQLPVFLTVT